MGKGFIFLAIFSVCTILMFCVMVYLMSTINPPPLKPHVMVLRTPATPTPVSPKRKYNHVLFDAGDTIPVMDPVLYGLDKADIEEIDFYPVTIGHITNIDLKNITGVYRFTRRKLLQPLWPRTLQTIVIGPTMHKVLPLIWPALTSPTAAKVDSTTPISSVKTSENAKLQNNTVSYSSDTNKTSAKPMKRRSVSNNLDDNLGSILLKILDNNGEPRIEIKLLSDNNSNKWKSVKIPYNDQFEFSMKSKNNHEILNNNNTVITIMMYNNTVVIDDMNDKIIQKNASNIESYPDLLRSLVLAAKTNENDNEIHFIDPEEHIQLNKSEVILSYGNISLKLLLQNKTRFNQNYTISSINDMNNTILHTKYSTDNDIKDNSDFDSVYTKFNTTKFIESVFEEEETNDFQETNPSSDITNTTFNQTTNKYTGVFIENESDLLNY